MLRIKALVQSRDEVVLEIEGWISQANIGLLETEIASHFEGAQQLVLDLGGVRNIDRSGLDLLGQWSMQGVAFKGESLFIRTLLRNCGLI